MSIEQLSDNAVLFVCLYFVCFNVNSLHSFDSVSIIAISTQESSAVSQSVTTPVLGSPNVPEAPVISDISNISAVANWRNPG